MAKALVFLLGLVSGSTAGLVFLSGVPIRLAAEPPSFADHIKSIEVEKVCRSIVSGSPGRQQVTAWNYRKRFLLVGWGMNKTETPYWYWAGMDTTSVCKRGE